MGSFKTTLAGILLGGPIGVDAVIDAAKQGAFDHQSGWQLIMSIAIMAVAGFAKDHDVTGGGTKMIALVGLLSLQVGTSHAQSVFKPIPRPTVTRHFRASVLSVSVDSTFQGFRVGGPVVLLALPDLSVFTGLGIEYQHSTYVQSAQRWEKDWGIGVSLLEGGQFVPGSLKAVTAVGAHVSFFDGFLTLGLLYNFSTRKVQGATGPMTQLFPSN